MINLPKAIESTQISLYSNLVINMALIPLVNIRGCPLYSKVLGTSSDNICHGMKLLSLIFNLEINPRGIIGTHSIICHKVDSLPPPYNSCMRKF